MSRPYWFATCATDGEIVVVPSIGSAIGSGNPIMSEPVAVLSARDLEGVRVAIEARRLAERDDVSFDYRNPDPPFERHFGVRTWQFVQCLCGFVDFTANAERSAILVSFLAANPPVRNYADGPEYRLELPFCTPTDELARLVVEELVPLVKRTQKRSPRAKRGASEATIGGTIAKCSCLRLRNTGRMGYPT